MSKLCLVTGGAGFIGSHLVEALLANGHRVRVLDDLSTGQLSNLEAFRPQPEIVQGDVSDVAAVERAMQGVNIVYHLAAIASVQRSVEEPEVTHRVCATGTLHVLNAARKAGVGRVVYAASSSAYGNLSSETGIPEDAPLAPLSPYAAAKLAGELYCQAFASTYGLETVRVRFFNIFGPRQRADSPYSGVIALFIAALAQGRTPTIFGDGLQSRDFTFVTDAVAALMLAAERPGVAGKVYNAGTGASRNLLDLVNGLNRLLGTKIEPKHAPARAGDVRFSQADIRHIQHDLGFHASVSFEEGLARTLAWYQQSQ